MLDIHHAQQRFNRSASTYEEHAILPEAVAAQLVDRLQYVDTKVNTIVDIGSGTGFVSQALAESRFAAAEVLQIDFAIERLRWQQAHNDFMQVNVPICADAMRLPLQNHSVDLLFSSLCLPYVVDIAAVFREWQRVLKPGGLCLFATLGPDTLIELRQAFAAVHNWPHVHGFYDMHDIGDALVKAQFAEPVMDVDNMTIRYDEVDDLLLDLKQQGLTNVLTERHRGCMTPRQLQQAKQAYPQQEGYLPATFEVIFATAWSTDAIVNKKINNEVRVPIHSIKKR